MIGEPFHIDLKKVRKASKGEVWFRQNAEWPDRARWTVGVGTYVDHAPTPEEALAHILVNLHNIAVFEGACD